MVLCLTDVHIWNTCPSKQIHVFNPATINVNVKDFIVIGSCFLVSMMVSGSNLL